MQRIDKFNPQRFKEKKNSLMGQPILAIGNTPIAKSYCTSTVKKPLIDSKEFEAATSRNL
jgi:hypothetical protein